MLVHFPYLWFMERMKQHMVNRENTAFKTTEIGWTQMLAEGESCSALLGELRTGPLYFKYRIYARSNAQSMEDLDVYPEFQSKKDWIMSEVSHKIPKPKELVYKAHAKKSGT